MKRVLIFGASDRILRQIKKDLNDNINIVGYIDNNSQLWGEKIGGKPIFSPKEGLNVNTYDAILIGSVYFAPLMRKQVIETNNYYKDRIYMFWNEETIKDIFFDPTLYISEEDIDWIYKEPQKMKFIFNNVCNKLPKVYKTENYKVLPEQSNAWWKTTGKLIAHAGGGYVNGKEQEYTNAKEAFYESYSNGFKYIEADIMETLDGELVACSWFRPYYDQEQVTYKQFLESCRIRNYSPMNIIDIINFMEEYQDVHIVLDIKSRTIEHYKHILSCIVNIVSLKNRGNEILERFVIQVHELNTLEIARLLCPFNDITMTLYRMHYDSQLNPSAIAEMCANNGVLLATMGREKMNYEYLRFFIARNIGICIHPVDRLEGRMKGKYLGVDSFLTNYLIP